MEGFDSLLQRADQAIGAGDFAALVGMPAEAVELTGQANELRQEFAADGYDVEPAAKPAEPTTDTPGIGAPQP
jgi:hypothetical protein